MKLGLLFLGLLLFSTELNACSCFGEQSLCNYTQNNAPSFEQNGLICIAEATGNHMGDYFESYYEMKIIEHIYGEIKPGDENFENTDSTFWIILGAGATCYDEGFFGNAGDQFVMAPVFSNHIFENRSIQGYSLYLCVNDVFKYADIMQGPIIQDTQFIEEEFIWNVDTVTADNLISVIADCTNFLIDDIDDYTNNIEQQLKVFPNPAVNLVYLDFNSSFLFSQALSIELTNLNGKIIQQQTLSSSANKIDVSHLAAGLYFLNIQCGKQLVSKRIVINK